MRLNRKIANRTINNGRSRDDLHFKMVIGCSIPYTSTIDSFERIRCNWCPLYNNNTWL